MKHKKTWSYAPYRMPFDDRGDIYISRVAPSETEISFDWLSVQAEAYSVFYRVRNEGEFVLAGKTTELTYTISGLQAEQEYEFYVEGAGQKSRIRLAACGPYLFGDSVINYLHPEDDAYLVSGRYLGSPSMLRHPDGYLIAAMDVFNSAACNITILFRSDDDGKTWYFLSELRPCFWGKLFIHKGDLYMLSCSGSYGDLLIGKSTDGGKTFGEPTVLYRGFVCDRGQRTGIHRNPQPVVTYAGRIWNTVEWGSWESNYFGVMVVSAPVDADLLDSDSWCFSEPVKYDPTWPGVAKGEQCHGNIEGNLIISGGKFYNVMRYEMEELEPTHGRILVYEVDADNPEAPLRYHSCPDFPGSNQTKFTILYDDKRKKFYTIANRITDPNELDMRNVLDLLESDDGLNFSFKRNLVDRRDLDLKKVGFQYVDFIIEGDEILYDARVAMNGAHSFHDSNYHMFGRIKINE